MFRILIYLKFRQWQTLDKDDDDKDMDYGYEGDFSLDGGSTSSDDTEDITTQQTTEEQQGRMVEFIFNLFLQMV